MFEDPEIHELLRQTQGFEELERRAMRALEVYRREALEAAQADAELSEKERAIAEARKRLKKRLRALLSPDSPAMRYEEKRERLLEEHGREVLEIRETAHRAWEEMLGREMELLTFDGFSPQVARQAAVNNLGVRKAELEAELERELNRLRDELRRKMQRIAEELSDFD